MLFASGRSRRARYSSESRPPGTLPSTNTASGLPGRLGTSGSKPSTSRACPSVVRWPTAGRARLRRRRQVLAPLDRGALEPEELEHRVAARPERPRRRRRPG